MTFSLKAGHDGGELPAVTRKAGSIHEHSTPATVVSGRRTMRLVAAGALLCLAVLSSGCLTSGKRLAYQYNPNYGVESPEFMRSLEVLRTQIVPGNRVTLLENGDGFFPDTLQSIREAKHSVNIEMYLFSEGEVGTEFAAALCERARAGIEVRVLVDDIGARLEALEDQMKAAGVRFQIYKPLRIYSLLRAGHRTHRKIITVDGRIGYCGGLGIDDRWKGNARNPREWRDLVVRVEGPVVSQLQSIFMEDWLHTTGEVLHGFGQFPLPEPAGKVLAQAVASARTDQSSMAKLMMFMAIQAARHRIWIENAYFVPDRQIRRSLIAAAQRGVDVRVIVPGEHADIPLVRRASRYHYGELLDGGIKIYEYRPTMLHSKAVVVDGIWTTIGSINFVTRSMVHNAEANVAIYDREFARQVERVIESDQALCEAFTKEAWRKRGLSARLGEALGWMFSEIY